MNSGSIPNKIRRKIGKGVHEILAPEDARELPAEWPVDFSYFTKIPCGR